MKQNRSKPKFEGRNTRYSSIKEENVVEGNMNRRQNCTEESSDLRERKQIIMFN